ncbi:MAG TPA: hypothetical protein VK178_06170 [Opitutaceae bacterium]|nr:hypothetical protein [Opitutaceae bacterium]
MISLRAPRSVGATIAALALVLAGCREEPVRTYRTSKEKLPPAEMPPAQTAGGELPAGHPPLDGSAAPAPNSGDTAALPPGHPPIGSGAMPPAAGAPTAAAAATNNSIVWAAPDHWVVKPLGAMRRGSFTAKNAAGEADCSIFVFPAASNPLLANINRWRGQVGLAPLAEAHLAAETTSLDNAAGLKFVTVELLGQTGAGATRVLGAILYRGEEAWFFKLSGPDAVVAAEKPAFLDFLRTVQPVHS